jgi:hypothetical protein
MKAKIINKNHSDWYSSAAFNEAMLLQGLHEIGLENSTIEECVKGLINFKKEENDRILLEQFHDPRYLRHYREGGFGLDLDRVKDKDYLTQLEEFKRNNSLLRYHSDGEYANGYCKSVIDKLKELLGFIEFRVEEYELIDLKLPIFKFNSPNIKGSEVIFETSDTHSEKNDCTFSIFGTGLGDTKSISLSFSNTFESRDGAYKLVFIPIKIKNSLISLYEKGKIKKQFIRSELHENEIGEYYEIGIDSMDKNEYFKLIEPIKTKRKFKLSGDKTPSKHTYKETINSSEAFSYEIGINAFKLNGNCKVNISRRREVKLELKLPTGNDYVLKEIMNGFGIICE